MIPAFANSAGFEYIDIPQGNTADELLWLRGGDADWCVVKVADIASMMTEVKVLAAFATEPLKEEGFEDVPLLKDLGYYPDWLGSSRMIAAPAGVSQEVVDFYANAFKQAMEDPEYLAEAASFVTDYKDAAATAELVKQ